jgi:ferredoxin-fold anticodon binding domain-containing protein
MKLTLSDIEGLKQSGKIRDFKVMEKKPEPKKAKYGNQKTDVNGITLASKKEAKRYKELNLLLKAGKIGMLARQVEYELNVGGSHSLKYIADFQYIDRETGETIVEDVKGTRTPTYKKKRRLMKKLFNIEIKEL